MTVDRSTVHKVDYFGISVPAVRSTGSIRLEFSSRSFEFSSTIGRKPISDEVRSSSRGILYVSGVAKNGRDVC